MFVMILTATFFSKLQHQIPSVDLHLQTEPKQCGEVIKCPSVNAHNQFGLQLIFVESFLDQKTQIDSMSLVVELTDHS